MIYSAEGGEELPVFVRLRIKAEKSDRTRLGSEGKPPEEDFVAERERILETRWGPLLGEKADPSLPPPTAGNEVCVDDWVTGAQHAAPLQRT